METIERCLFKINHSQSDNEKLAALMVLTKVWNKLDIEKDISAQLFQAISPTFLIRLLRSKKFLTSKQSFRLLAVEIVAYFVKVNPSLIFKRVEDGGPIVQQLLHGFDATDDKADSGALYDQSLNIFLSISQFDAGVELLIQNDVFSTLGMLLHEDEDGLTGKIILLFKRVLMYQGKVGGDFVNIFTILCRCFKVNQELQKFQYLKDISNLLGLIISCELSFDDQKENIALSLGCICFGCRDILQSHLKADCKRSVLKMLSSLVKVCGGVDWLFDKQCSSFYDSFIVLMLVSVSVEVAFMLQAEKNDEDDRVIEDSLFLAESVLTFICSDRFEGHQLASDPDFICQVFGCMKNIMKYVYTFLLENPNNRISLLDKATVASISFLSMWATEETENLREELKQTLPTLIKLAKDDFENLIYNEKEPIILDIMAPFLAQTIPDENMRDILIFHKCDDLYVNYLKRLLSLVPLNRNVKTEAIEVIFNITHQFVILNPELCSSDPWSALLAELLQFVPHVPSNLNFSHYCWLEMMVITLRLLELSKTGWSKLAENFVAFSIQFVYNLTKSAKIEENIIDILYIAFQNILAFCQSYRNEISRERFSYLKGWRCKGVAQTNLKDIINDVVTALLE